MTQSAAIYGMSGLSLNKDENNFFAKTQPYGFILFARNCESPAQIKALIAQLHEVTGRAQLPILIDQEGGRVARLKPPHWPEFPAAAVFAKLFEHDKASATRAAYLNARLIAHTLNELGITVDCAPVADIPVAGAHDVIGDRAFGNTPAQVITLARTQAKGLLDGGVIPVLKHIPGHGRAGADSHESLPVVEASLEELRATDFESFKALSDLPMAMTAHVLYTAIDRERMATISPSAIKLIREEIGFNGLLMSDDLSMKALKGSFTQRAKDVLAAGCDVVLHCNGKMDEMRATAEGTGALSGKALARAQAALAAIQAPDAFDAPEARFEVKQRLSAAA